MQHMFHSNWQCKCTLISEVKHFQLFKFLLIMTMILMTMNKKQWTVRNKMIAYSTDFDSKISIHHLNIRVILILMICLIMMKSLTTEYSQKMDMKLKLILM